MQVPVMAKKNLGPDSVCMVRNTEYMYQTNTLFDLELKYKADLEYLPLTIIKYIVV
jgi:hypothetical protein